MEAIVATICSGIYLLFGTIIGIICGFAATHKLK